MDRSPTRQAEYFPPMRAAGAGPVNAVLRAVRPERRQPGIDASDRRAVSADAVLRQPQTGRGPGSQSEAGAAADAFDGTGGDVSEALDVASGAGAQDLPVFA